MKIISIINMKGGVAKTTLTVNLADCLCRRHGKKVLVIDVDPQFNATQCVFSPKDYVEYLKKGGDTILNIFDRSTRPVVDSVDGSKIVLPKKLEDIFPVKKERFDILPGNLELYRLEMGPGEGRENRLKIYLEKLAESHSYDFVLIDTPPTPSIWMTSALIASDHYLIPVKTDPISFTGIDLLLSIIEARKENFTLKISCIGLVFTIVEEMTTVYQEACKYVAKHDIWKNFVYKKFLPKRVKVAAMQSKQQFVLDSRDDGLKLALSDITSEFLKRIDAK